MTASDTVTKKAAKEVLKRMKLGGSHTLAEEARQLGLSSIGPLKAALEAACGGAAGYRKMMGERRYPRRSAAERKAAKDEARGDDVEKMARAAGVRVVRKKKVEVAPASTKKREAGVVTVELDEGGAVDEDGGGTDDNRGGSAVDEAGGGGGAEDDEEAGEVDCVDGMSSGGGRAWAKEYWSAGVR